MQEIICAPFLQQFIAIDRKALQPFIVPEALYDKIASAVARRESPAWIGAFLAKFGIEPQNKTLDQFVLVRPKSKFNFGRATYETNQSCNFRCKHCVLGERDLPHLMIEQRLPLIHLMADAGVLFAHLTGGEITADKHFLRMYELAFDLGMLIDLSTNGSLLWREDIRQILVHKPPYKIGISIYGGSEDTVNAFTENKIAWQNFLKGMETICELGLQHLVFAKIILTTYNQHELDKMVNMLQGWGFNFHTYKKIFPTHTGSQSPMCVEACDATQLPTTMEKVIHEAAPRDWFERCKAGRNFFHIDSLGMASLCSTARRPAVDLTEKGLDGLAELENISRAWLQTPTQCGECGNYDACLSCPPKLAMYARAGVRKLPTYVCGRASAPEIIFTENQPHLFHIQNSIRR